MEDQSIMENPPNSLSTLFGEYYYMHNCGAPYERTETWLAFFGKIADRILSDFHPQTVLDAGCAKGFLVEGFRSRGVEAWGIDLSEFAIQSVHADIKNYCFVGSIAQPLPRKYDLIVSIEVVEHMPAEEAVRAIENLCQYSDNIIISTSPYDYKEATHMNVHPPDYWARQFARFGFYHDIDYDASFITPWAMRFYRLVGSVQPVVQAYERHLWQMQTELKELRSSVIEYHERLHAAGDADTQAELKSCRQQLVDMQNTHGWKMVQKLQSLRVQLAPPGSRRGNFLKRMLGKD
jgi:SAM-dependent methyltransferase